FCCFFFSSRRRHTRSKRDWSSDVCSSDLLCGVHGTISLAIALTLPYMLADHHSFVFRDDLLFIASGMVIISLIIAQFVLPIVTPNAVQPKQHGMSFNKARVYILENDIEHLNKLS